MVLTQWNNSPRIDMSPHSDTLFWFQVNQSLLFLLNAACLAEKQQMPSIVFGLTLSGFEPTFYRTRGEQEEPVFIFIIIHHEVSIYNLHNLWMIGKQTVSNSHVVLHAGISEVCLKTG